MGTFFIPDIPNCAVAIRSLTALVMISSTSSLLTSKTPTLDLMTVRNSFFRGDLCGWVLMFYISLRPECLHKHIATFFFC